MIVVKAWLDMMNQRLFIPFLTTLLFHGCTPAVDPDETLSFLEGTWSTVKDGLSLTVVMQPNPDGKGWIETTIVDDANQVTATATMVYDKAAEQWIYEQNLSAGATSTFKGGLNDKNELVLEQFAYNGNVIEPLQSRLVYMPVSAEQLTVDWQSRGEAGEWTPRDQPYVYTRVERPIAPTGAGRIAFISNREENWEIYTMNPDGSNVRNVSNHPAGDHRPAWIAGSTRLAFRSQRARDDGGWDRWEADLDGTDTGAVDLPGRLSNSDFGMFPQFHPSGSYVANAAERDGEQDIYIWRFDGGGERVVAPAPGIDYRPIFSPDGTKILFISERDGNAEVYTVAFDGSDVRRLTNTPGIDRYARWSPDGRQIGFVSDRDGDLEVYVMHASGDDVRQLTFNDAEDGEISWSPDGRRIAFRSDASGNGEINVVDLETLEVVNISNHEGYDGEPVWSH